MPRVKLFDLVIDLASLNSFRRFVQRGGRPSADNPINVGLKKSALMYAEWLRQKFLERAYSGGTANWPDIEESTKDEKARKGFDPDAILIRRETLMDAIGIAWNQEEGGYDVGYAGPEAEAPHWKFPGKVMQLAQLLQETGVRNGKTWKIIIPPSSQLKNSMFAVIRGGVSEAVRRANEANRR